MADIDFDELDKAVNTLMSGAKQSSPAATAEPAKSDSPSADEPKEATPGATEAPQPAVEESAEAQPAADQSPTATATEPSSSEPATETAPTAAPVEQKSLATKRRGQFMDMKHPSADMKTTSAAETSKPPRVGITIAPLSGTDAAPKTPDEPTAPEMPDSAPADAVDPPAEVEVPEIEIPEVPMPTGATDVKTDAVTPDTNDEPAVETTPEAVAGQESDHEPTPADEPHLAPAPERVKESSKPTELAPEVGPTTTPEQQTDAPSEDQTKPDSDLETNNEPESAPVPEPAPAAPSDASGTDEPTPSSPFLPDAKVEKRPLGQPAPAGEQTAEVEPEAASSSASLPEELQDSVLAVESDTTMKTDTHSADSSPSDGKDDKPADASIPYQYKTADAPQAESNEPDTSLYDTAGQHDAFSASPKRSHWAIVLGIIAIIILGAAIGAGAYVLQAGLI